MFRWKAGTISARTARPSISKIARMLPKAFLPVGTYDLLRLGPKFDGGYVIERRALDNSAVLVSLGIGNNWQFEEDFLAENDVYIEAFEHTISKEILWREFIRKIYKIFSLKSVVVALYQYRRFSKLFRGKIHHTQIGAGYNTSWSVNLCHLIRDISHIFLKCDIEGWEYRLLEDIIVKAKNLEGLVIEFHDVDLHRERIVSFIEKLPLNVCHIHANNNAGVDDRGDPLVVEISFTKYPPIADGPVSLPGPLDHPNIPELPEIIMTFGA